MKRKPCNRKYDSLKKIACVSYDEAFAARIKSAAATPSAGPMNAEDFKKYLTDLISKNVSN